MMADQTHCHICKRHLRKGGIWCVICKGYIYVSCSGLQSSKFYYDGFSCIKCTPENFAKRPNSTNRPTSTAPITTQKETSPATSETNVLPNATQSESSPPTFTTAPFRPWKLIDQEIEIKINEIYKNVVNWKPRFIVLSQNKPGFQFVLNQQLLSLVEETPSSNVSMKTAMIIPHLLLPKTKSETNGSNSKTLSRRLILWKQGLLDELFTETKALQIRHPKQKKSEVNEEAKQFDKLMSTGKISAAIGCLSDKKTQKVLPLNEVIEGKTVLNILKEKHPPAKTANTNYITELNDDTMPYHPSIFEQINAKEFRKLTLKTHGSHGPSGLDACEWRRILTHFNQTSIELCKTIANLSYTIATKVVPTWKLNSLQLMSPDTSGQKSRGMAH